MYIRKYFSDDSESTAMQKLNKWGEKNKDVLLMVISIQDTANGVVLFYQQY